MVSSEGGFTTRFWILIGATFLGFLGIGTVLPALAPHVKQDLGGSDQVVGWVIGTFSFMALASRFFSGPLADRRGRKITFLTGLLSCASAGAVYVLPLGLASAFGGRMLQGFGEACLYTGAAAWAVEVAGVQRSGQALGYLSSGIWGGISAGPVLGHWVGSFTHAALFQLGTAVGAFCLALFVQEDFRPGKHTQPPAAISSSLVLPGLAIGFVNVHCPVIAGFLILYLTQHGDSGPAAFTAYALLILLSRFFLGGLPDRLHPGITFYAGLAGMAAGLLILATGPRPIVAIGAAALLGLGFSFPWSSVAAHTLRQTPVRSHGSAIGVLSAFCDLFVGLSSLGSGRIAQQHGYPAAFLVAAAALAGSAVAGYFVFIGARRRAFCSSDEVLQPSELAVVNHSSAYSFE
jgi:MFS family permease